MNEQSVSAPFVKGLRERLPEGEVVKVHDASTTGLPDLSVTFAGREFKFEFKFWIPLHSWDGSPETVPVEKIALDSKSGPLQLALMKRYTRSATIALYIIWVKKSRCIVFWDPSSDAKFSVQTTPEAVDLISLLIRKWES